MRIRMPGHKLIDHADKHSAVCIRVRLSKDNTEIGTESFEGRQQFAELGFSPENVAARAKKLVK